MNLAPATPELGPQTPQRAASEERKSSPGVAKSPPERWNLGALESGLEDGGGSVRSKEAASSSASLEKKEKDEEKDEDATAYPEGGLGAWLVVLGSWCAIFASLGTASAFGSFQSYFIAHQLASYSPGAVGWIFSVYTFVAFAGGMVTGPLFDRHGARWLVLAGSAGVCASMLLLGLCREFWHFVLVFGLVGGGGSCLLYTPAVGAIGHYFKRARGHALGVAFSSSAIGGVVLPLLLEHLIPRVGFAWSTRVIGGMYVCVCAVACALVSARLPPEKSSNARPDFGIFRDSAFSVTVVAVYLLQWAFFVPLAYINSFALHHGFSSSFASLVLVLLNVGSAFGRWLPGLIGDRLGHYNSIILMTMLTVVSVLGVWLPVGHTRAGLIAFALTFGFTSGSILTLTAACIGQLCETKNYGRYYATAYTVASFGYLTGIPIGGELVGMDGGDYGSLIMFVGVCYGGAVVALLVVRILRTGWKMLVVY